MYICNECGEVFGDYEIFESKSYSFSINGVPYYEKINECPICGSDDIEETTECENCGKDISMSDAYDNEGLCSECYKETDEAREE